MTRGGAATALAVIDIVAYAGLSVVGSMTLGPDLADPVAAAMFGTAVAAFTLMGALLIRRVPTNLIGALLLAAGTAQVVGLGLQIYGNSGGSGPASLPGAGIALALTDVWYLAPFMIALIGVPLVFPDGRLPARRFRWVVGATIGGMAATAIAGLVPLVPGLADADAISGGLVVISVIGIMIGLGGAAAAIWVRFRRGSSVERQQVKWLLADAGVAAVAFPLAMAFAETGSLLDLAFWLAGFGAYVALPVSIGIAVLRYRLYEIDQLISRTVSYAIVTGVLAAVFTGTILLFQSVLEPLTGGSTVPVAASTLIVAALVQPLGRRVQAVVDRRFNRARYHAERTATAFSARLRDEVDLGSVVSDLLGVVARTIAPAAAGLWVRSPEVDQ